MAAGEGGSHATSRLDGLELGPTGILQLLGECLDIEGATSWIISATNIRPELDKLNTERAKRLATRKQPITAVSEFPLLDAKSVETPPTSW
jgi:hypothetical protein